MLIFFHEILHRTRLSSPLAPWEDHLRRSKFFSVKILDFQLSRRYFQKNIVLDPLKCVFWMEKNLGKPPALSDEVQHKKLIIYTLSLC